MKTLETNHARLSAISDRGRTADIFASGGAAEDLTLIGEIIPAAELPAAKAAADNEQGELF